MRGEEREEREARRVGQRDPAVPREPRPGRPGGRPPHVTHPARAPTAARLAAKLLCGFWRRSTGLAASAGLREGAERSTSQGDVSRA